MADAESAARSSLRRSLVVYAVFLAMDIVALTYILSSGPGGAGYVTLAVVGAVGLLLVFQVWMHVRDMGAPVAETRGLVQRKWSRADLIIAWHSYYVSVERRVFRLRPEDHVMLDEAMYVKVVHFPRTLHVVSIEEEKKPALPATTEAP